MRKAIKEMNYDQIATEALKVSVNLVNNIHRDHVHEGQIISKALISKEDLYKMYVWVIERNEQTYRYLQELQERKDELDAEKKAAENQENPEQELQA